jgi:hypothetical protein
MQPGEYELTTCGYVLLPPGIYGRGEEREWRANPYDGYHIEVAPEWAVEMLNEAAAEEPPSFTFTVDNDLGGKLLYDTIRDTLPWWTQYQIEEGPEPGDDHSQTDALVIIELATIGLGDDEIRAIYSAFPIGTKSEYAERGDPYLDTTIANVRENDRSWHDLPWRDDAHRCLYGRRKDYCRCRDHRCARRRTTSLQLAARRRI